jgi:hypothetical protein
VTPTTAMDGAFCWRDIWTLAGGDAYLGLDRVGSVAEKKWFWRKRESEAIDLIRFDSMGLEILERERKKGFLLVGLYRER